MRNGEVAAAICEQHDKEVIFAAAIQAISIVMAGGQPTVDHMDKALALKYRVSTTTIKRVRSGRTYK